MRRRHHLTCVSPPPAAVAAARTADDDLTVDNLLTSISTTLKVKAIETYALYDVSTVSDPIFLEHKLKVMNVMQDWQKKVKLGKGKVRPPVSSVG